MSRAAHLSCMLIGLCMVNQVWADQVHAAVAANFMGAMKSIVQRFEIDTEHDVVLSFSSSGKLLSQIKNGAPYEVFLSADQDKPKALIEAGLVKDDSQFTYAIGALALWSTKPDIVVEDFTHLTSGNFNKLALANPKLAPYGVAATEVLDALGLTESTKRKWVQGENIAQTYQFVASGNADLGFVALSQIRSRQHVAEGNSWVIPSHLYSPIRQDAVLLKKGEANIAALDLLAYLKSDVAQKIIQSYGYKTE